MDRQREITEVQGIPQALDYSSLPESRPIGWMVRGYVWWVAACYAGQALAEMVFQLTEVRGDFPAKLGEAMAYTSMITASGLFLVGLAYFINRKGACRWARVWVAWLASGAYPALFTFVLGTPILFPILYK
jgi:hypothetical protein